MKRIITKYTVRSLKIKEALRLAVAADLHSTPYEDVMNVMTECDAVLIPGDLVDRHRRNNSYALQFLKEVPEKVPVFYSPGNHEIKFRKADEYTNRVLQSKAVYLQDKSCTFRGISIGGLSSRPDGKPNCEFLELFEKAKGFRLLLCHHPEIYRDYVKGKDIDLTVCGHAHGGQIQIGGRGLYAPGQGLFPKLTHGMYDGGRMLLSRGMTNGAKPRIPRVNNPCELIILELEPEGGKKADERGRPEIINGVV